MFFFLTLQECTMTSKERRKALHKFGNQSSCWSNSDNYTKSNYSNSNNVDNWLLSRTNPGSNFEFQINYVFGGKFWFLLVPVHY